MQKAMQKASPGAFWVIQAWGGNPTRELLSGLDPERALVLQLTKDMADGGKNLRTFNGIPWVWCELANFGGNTGMYGGVPLLSRLGSELSGYKDKGLVGMGTLSEGLETNPCITPCSATVCGLGRIFLSGSGLESTHASVTVSHQRLS